MTTQDEVRAVQAQLQAAGEAVGGAVEEAATRLSFILESALQLAFQRTLADAAVTLNEQLEGTARIDLLLTGGEPVLAATVMTGESDTTATPEQEDGLEEGPSTRFTLRVPDTLKGRVEAAAKAEGISLNTWFVRTAARALSAPATQRGRNSISGWLG